MAWNLNFCLLCMKKYMETMMGILVFHMSFGEEYLCLFKNISTCSRSFGYDFWWVAIYFDEDLICGRSKQQKKTPSGHHQLVLQYYGYKNLTCAHRTFQLLLMLEIPLGLGGHIWLSWFIQGGMFDFHPRVLQCFFS
jgi:hypothetical protein